MPPAVKKAVSAKGVAKTGSPKQVPAKRAPAKKAAPVKSAAKKSSAAKPKGSPRRQKRDSCFVMSPFDTWQDLYYTDVYCPAIEQAGLKPHRADDLYRPSSIVQDIWTYVKESRVMLADLTGKNANVFYELGLAHALDKPVVLLSQSMEDVPFDLRSLRVITYEIEHPSWGSDLRERITAALREVLTAPETAVLQPFNREKADRGISTEDEQNPMFRSLMREVNLLRAEVSRKPRPKEIGPDEARRLIERYVSQGMSTGQIIDRLLPLGPPLSWVNREIQAVRRERRQPSPDLEAIDA